MTPNARTVLPTDLVALVSYDGRVYANEAITLDRIGSEESPHPLEAALEQWFSFATGRHTWISVKGATLRGLVSARKRGSKMAWEIDCLINAEDNDPAVVMSLLDQVTDAAGRSGAHKIVLRVPSESMTVADASRCGFAPYRHERLWKREQERAEARAATGMRRRIKSDLYPVYQLYNATVPESIRRYEAATVGEWQASTEHIGRASQFVLATGDRIGGLLRVAGDGDTGRFDLLGDIPALDTLIAAAMAKLANRPSVCALVPEHQQAVATRLAEIGFTPADEYTVLVRRTVRTVKKTAPATAVVQSTFG